MPSSWSVRRASASSSTNWLRSPCTCWTARPGTSPLTARPGFPRYRPSQHPSVARDGTAASAEPELSIFCENGDSIKNRIFGADAGRSVGWWQEEQDLEADTRRHSESGARRMTSRRCRRRGGRKRHMISGREQPCEDLRRRSTGPSRTGLCPKNANVAVGTVAPTFGILLFRGNHPRSPRPWLQS